MHYALLLLPIHKNTHDQNKHTHPHTANVIGTGGICAKIVVSGYLGSVTLLLKQSLIHKHVRDVEPDGWTKDRK